MKNGIDMKRIYVDMDDVLCKFRQEFDKRRRFEPGIQWPQATYGFFEGLEEIEGAIDGIRELTTEYDVWILTKPSVLNPLCYTEKRVWVEKHLGVGWCHKLILSPDKSLFKGDYLIDDCIHIGFEGEHIHFSTERFPDWNAVTDYLLKK